MCGEGDLRMGRGARWEGNWGRGDLCAAAFAEVLGWKCQVACANAYSYCYFDSYLYFSHLLHIDGSQKLGLV